MFLYIITNTNLLLSFDCHFVIFTYTLASPLALDLVTNFRRISQLSRSVGVIPLLLSCQMTNFIAMSHNSKEFPDQVGKFFL